MITDFGIKKNVADSLDKPIKHNSTNIMTTQPSQGTPLQPQGSQQQPNQSLVRLTKALIDRQPDVRSLMELEPVQNQWVQTYKKISGREDGNLKFEAEKLMFLQAVNTNADLAKCDKFTIYSSFIELAASGLSLRDGMSFIIPYGGKAQWQPGWKGRLEQINQMQQVVHCPEPILIREGDEYKITAGERLNIHHIPVLGNKGQILAVYLPLQMEHGTEFIMMNRDEVLSIRDRYSKPYIAYIKALQSDANKGRKEGDKLVIKYKDKQGNWKEFESDPPMWVTDEGQAFKKTLIKRAYNSLPKLPSQKYLDDLIAKRERIDVDDLNNKSQADKINQATDEEVNPIEAAINLPDGDYVDCEPVNEQGNINEVLADKPTDMPPIQELGGGLD